MISPARAGSRDSVPPGPRSTVAVYLLLILLLLLAQGAAVPLPARAQEADPRPVVSLETGADAPAPVEAILAHLEPAALRSYAREVVERNPEVARARARAATATTRAPQVRSLPDPMASLTLFLLPPETRVGPQRAQVGLSQRLPWFGKLRARERVALLEAVTAERQVEVARLAALAEARRLYWELAFLEVQAETVETDRQTLSRYEELARARYEAGMGLAQAVVKLQAEISRADVRLLEIEGRRAALLATANALRDRQAAAPVLPAREAEALLPLPETEVPGTPALWSELSVRYRPEHAVAAARLEVARARGEVARLEAKPDVTLGLGYTAVERRTDSAGRRNPPEGNGDDILALTGSVQLPVWKERIAAGIEEAAGLEREAEAEHRAHLAMIEGELGDVRQQLALIRDRIYLLEDVLAIQAEEALRSAEAGYGAGTQKALDLVDSERLLLDVRIAAARARADYRIALARLETALAAPLAALTDPPPPDSIHSAALESRALPPVGETP